MQTMIARIGAHSISITRAWFGLFSLLVATIKGFVRQPAGGSRRALRETAAQLYFTAIQPLPFVLGLGVVFTAALFLASRTLLGPYGLQNMIDDFVVVGMVREIGPLVVATILIGRTGSAVATEIGSTTLFGGLEELARRGFHADAQIVLPRLLGVGLGAACLLLVFALSGLSAGLLLVNSLPMVAMSFQVADLATALHPSDLAIGLAKTVFFGVGVVLANSFHALEVRSPRDLARACAKGASQSLVFCFAINALGIVWALN